MTIDNKKARIILEDGKEYSANVIHDNMGGMSLDISGLRKETGYITYDPGFMNTGSCMSSICYIDGEKYFSNYKNLEYSKKYKEEKAEKETK